MMKAIVKPRPGPGAELIEVDPPKVGPGDCLIKVERASICGTDYHIYRWDQWSESRIRPPRIFGHECAGTVVEIGEGVVGVKKGDFISAETHIACGHCYFCRTGLAHICREVKILGVDIDGVFAEYVRIPYQNCWVLPGGFPTDYASVMEPFGNAVHSVTEARVEGENVLITGAGPIGLMSIMVARSYGANRIIVAEINDYRLEMAGKVGADLVINPNEEDLVAKVQSVTGGIGVDVVLEMSGAESAITQGLKSLRGGGRFVILGIPKRPITLDISPLIVFKQATVIGVNGRRMFDTWFRSTRLILDLKIDLEKIITHRLPMDRFEEGMELMGRGECGKILLLP